jgi:hypothetical protein
MPNYRVTCLNATEKFAKLPETGNHEFTRLMVNPGQMKKSLSNRKSAESRAVAGGAAKLEEL